MSGDLGGYTKDPETYKKLVEELYSAYSWLSLPPEYDYFMQEDLLTLLIRLARYKFVSRMIKKTDRLLEIGCGSGVGCTFLSQHCLHATGLDVKAPVIDEAKSICRRPNIEFVLEDFFEFEPRGCYDVVVALDVIEHMPVQQGKELVAKMARLMVPTGMAVIGTPSTYSSEWQGAFSKAGHVKCYDCDELVSVIEESFGRTIVFSMNDELVHTGFPKLAWYYFVLGFVPDMRK